MDDYQIIKDNFGEKFAQLCRTLFPSILENPGLLSRIILSTFSPNHFLYEDIIKESLQSQFKNFILTKANIKYEIETSNKTVRELLAEAGYDFYECHTEKDIQSFRKYYADGEELCTFDGSRLETKHVFWAVKKNIETIKRENFTKPERQDEYGTSVISIQFDRGLFNNVNIMNRYNHTVNLPDATFSNNLENIIPGLTNAFEREYGFKIDKTSIDKFTPYHYVVANDGKYYKYNYYKNNIYYCTNNIIIDKGEVKHFDKEKYIVFDFFILDKMNKTIRLYDEKIKDSFIDGFSDLSKTKIDDKGKIKKTIITEYTDKETGNKIIKIKPIDQEEITITIDKYNKLIEYDNKNLTNINDKFLTYKSNIEVLNLPNVKSIGNDFIISNSTITEINLPNVEVIGNHFLECAPRIEKINLPNIKIIGNEFINYPSSALKKIELPSLISIGNDFLTSTEYLEEINLPNVKTIGNGFLSANTTLRKANLPSLISIGNFAFEYNEDLLELNAPNLKIIGYRVLCTNKILKKLDLPNLTLIDEEFLKANNHPQIMLLKLKIKRLILLSKMKKANNKDMEEYNEESSNKRNK